MMSRIVAVLWRIAALFIVALVAPLVFTGAAQADVAAQNRESLVNTYVAGIDQSQGLAVAASVGSAVQVRKDYGLVDRATGVPVDETFAFEWGRVSDLLVWTSVMQLVESGEVSLKAAIQTYLPEETLLPDGCESLDLLDLMNHASGLDVAVVGSRLALGAGDIDASKALPLFDVEAVFEPGSIVGYTPYDSLLAALVVQGVTGIPFAEYVEENIFKPLGMNHTVLRVGGDPATVSNEHLADDGVVLSVGYPGPMSVSSPRPTTSSVFTCVGTVDDLVLFGQSLVGAEDVPPLFDNPDTSSSLFSVTRTYPSLGIARFAHGMFCFPFTSGVFGMSGTTTSGYTCSLYMNPELSLAVAVMVNQSGRADLTQGISRVLFGRTDYSIEGSVSPENLVWAGTYQSAGDVDQGVGKILTALNRIEVGTNWQGVLTIDGLTATSMGAGVYAVDSAIDQDVYRFHVSLERGAEFSRVDEDYYIVPAFMLAIEAALLGMCAASMLLCGCYSLVCLVSLIRAAIRKKRPNIQIAPMTMSVMTLVCGSLAGYEVFKLSEGLVPGEFEFLLVIEAAYCVLSIVLIIWLLVTRWRGSSWTRGQNMLSMAVIISAVITMLNLVYWEMLP